MHMAASTSETSARLITFPNATTTTLLASDYTLLCTASKYAPCPSALGWKLSVNAESR